MAEKKYLVLLADDSRDLTEAYAKHLRENGFRTAIADDGRKAINKARALSPDLILMDLSMPNVGGWEAIQELKQDKKTRKIPVILATAYGSEVTTAMQGCCECFLTKPVMLRELLEEVERVLAGRKPLQQQKQLRTSSRRALTKRPGSSQPNEQAEARPKQPRPKRSL